MNGETSAVGSIGRTGGQVAVDVFGGMRGSALNQNSTLDALGNGDQQQVWGVSYIDELVQEGVNSNPSADNTCETVYWVCQDANYNVMGLVDNGGVLVERYEYTPYGQRTVFFSPGSNDVGCYAPTLTSRKIVVNSVAQPYGLCEFGHQGLQHDEESGLVYNRARELHPVLGRFMQRDPLGYVDGMNAYQYLGSDPIIRIDASGLWGDDVHKGLTARWATDLYYPQPAADAIGSADAAVDGGRLGGGTGWAPWGTQSYHFNRNGGVGGDSRTFHYNEHMAKAIGLCWWDNSPRTDDPAAAAQELGTALHPLQDIVAHADYFTKERGNIWTVHNALSPQTDLFAAHGRDVTNYPDDPTLDAVNGPNGMATNAVIVRDYVEVPPPPSMPGAPPSPPSLQGREYAIYTPGTLRIKKTEADTKQALALFHKWVAVHGGCKCKSYFGVYVVNVPW